MPVTAADLQRLLPELLEFISMKAPDLLEEKPETSPETPHADYEATPAERAAMGAKPEDKKPGGLAVVIDMASKKPGAGGEKVPGCPDCADGTPHEHVK